MSYSEDSNSEKDPVKRLMETPKWKRRQVIQVSEPRRNDLPQVLILDVVVACILAFIAITLFLLLLLK